MSALTREQIEYAKRGHYTMDTIVTLCDIALRSLDAAPSAIAAPALTAAEVEEWRKKIKDKIFSDFLGEPNEAHGKMLMGKFDTLCDMALGNSAPPEEAPKREWLIWSNEHRSYWGADRCGYRDDPRDAGRYTLAEARSICNVRSMEIVPPETMIHELEACRGPYMNNSRLGSK